MTFLPVTVWRGVCALLMMGLQATRAPAAEQPAPLGKPFVLFMGADIDLQGNRGLHRLEDVAGDDFVVRTGEKIYLLPMNREKVGIRVSPQLKLTDHTAAVTGLKVERAYTPANDPHRRFAAAQSGSAAQATVGAAASQMSSAMMGAQLASQRGSALGGPAGPLDGADASAQIGAFNDANRAAGSDLNSAGYTAARLQEELEKELFDATLVTCEVAAPVPVRNPYLVVVAHYRDKQDPGATRSWIFAKDLERLDPKPLQVRVFQGGFPPGFELVRSEVHVYGDGRELGTNVADKNVWLTREEAHQYLVLEYLAAHKGETLPPAVNLGLAAEDLTPHFEPAALQEMIFVRVNRDGLPLGVFRDEDLVRPGGEILGNLVAAVRFHPALQKGKAVDGIARLRIADLAP